MNAPRHRALIPAIAGLLLVAAACTSSGGLGPVPTVPPTTAPSIEPGPSDETPSIPPSPSASPSGSPSSPSSSPSTPSSGEPSPSTPAETMLVRAYYILDGAPGVEGLVPTLRVVPKSTGVARAAMNALLDFPGADPSLRVAYTRIGTAIPSGTEVLGLSIKNGVATIDLSSEFESGGGTASARYRLGQVVYTLTQYPTVRSVLFQVEGRTVTTFGAEGIVLDGPQARKDFEDLLPSIFVDRPAFRAAAGNPARITGNANVFEATFRIALLDASGKVLVDQQAMATCGSGCRGTFDATLQYDVPKAQYGTLRVYFGSAKDGSPQDIRDYPVWLTPN
ncbi:MAG TPA: GerMN domain-containing protein [Candidatus Limnocylindrales bacterium]|nr:GerMN domain-containing protein [Candidatus Limnocylindrales bacterium]